MALTVRTAATVIITTSRWKSAADWLYSGEERKSAFSHTGGSQPKELDTSELSTFRVEWIWGPGNEEEGSRTGQPEGKEPQENRPLLLTLDLIPNEFKGLYFLIH